MNDTIKDFVGVEEIPNPMSESEYHSFLARMAQKRYKNEALRDADRNVIDANDQILAGANILEKNKIGL
jgi:hypothetical protein